MRNRLLTLLGMALIAMTSFAQSWTAPEPMDPDEEPSALASEHVYKVRNVASQWYLSGGQVWFSWSTTALLTEYADDAIDFLLTQETKGWTLQCQNKWNGCYLFVSGNGKEGYAMHVDNASDQHRYFEIIDQGENKYRLRVAEADDTYGKAMTEDWEDKFVCWDKADATNGGCIQAALVPDDENTFAEFEFIDQNVHLYNVKTQLYNLAKAIVDEELDVDYEQYTEVYNGSDYEALKQAVAALQTAYDLAKAYKVLSVGQDGVNPPSDDNPCDATSLIKNADFSAGNASGWTCTFVGGTNATNVGYQGANYTNGSVRIDKFIEAWANSAFNPNYTWRAIGDGKLSQTMAALPQGKYTFTCDAIANQQDGHNPVTGVELFATGGELEMTQAIATGNGAPEHFEVTFVSTGGDVEIGLRTNNATANWIAADNFTLTYFGETKDDPAKVLLDAVIRECESKYDVSTLKANKDVIDAYSTALAKAKAAVEDYEAVGEELKAAAKALQTSVDEYAAFRTAIEDFSAKVTAAESEWPGISSSNVSDVYIAALNSYSNCTATSESIADFTNASTQAIADYISANVTPGKDVSILLNNPGFDHDQSGWEISNYDGTGAVSAGNHRWGGHSVVLPEGFVKEGGVVVEEKDTLVSGCNEIWRGAFKYQQTIYNMPAGLYTLSCKGFQRNEDNQNDTSVPDAAAELFAIMGDNVQTQKFANIFGDCSDEMLYNGASEGDEGVAYGGSIGTETDLNTAGPAEGKYYPNGMCGASAHFAAGYYKQEFDILVTETSDIVIGARCKANYYWTLFDDFKIVYKGKEAGQLNNTIDKLIAQINSAQENEDGIVLTKDVKAQAVAAIAAGEAAKVSGDFDQASEAVTALRVALADVQENMDFMKDFYAYYKEMNESRGELDEDYYEESAGVTIPEIVETVGNKLITEDLAFADSAEVEKYRLDMDKAYVAAVMDAANVASASETNPVNVSAAIYNPQALSYDEDDESGEYYATGAKGWTVSEGTVGYGNSDMNAIEFFQQAFDYNQTIYGLVPGFYRLYVNGYYRDGNGARIDSCYNKKEGFTEERYARLYANEAETGLLLITEGESFNRYNEYIEDGNYADITTGNSHGIKTVVDDENVTLYIPNLANAANAAFNVQFNYDEDQMWLNCLQFEVKDKQESVTIGIRKSHNANVEADPENGVEEVQYGDWTIFDNWQLYYIGTETPEEDPTTAILGVDYKAPAKAAIFNLAGQRVAKAQKGIYIINGKKVVVK